MSDEVAFPEIFLEECSMHEYEEMTHDSDQSRKRSSSVRMDGPTHPEEVLNLSLECAKILDQSLELEDACSLMFLISVRVKHAHHVCSIFEAHRENRYDNDRGIVQVLRISADRFYTLYHTSAQLVEKLLEAFVLTNNLQAISLMGHNAEEVVQRNFNFFKTHQKMILELCRQTESKDQNILTDFFISQGLCHKRYQMLETQILEMMLNKYDLQRGEHDNSTVIWENCVGYLRDLLPKLGLEHLLEHLQIPTKLHFDHIKAPKQCYPQGPGMAIIINQKNFYRIPDNPASIALGTRNGADVDRERLRITFTLLGAIEVRVFCDLDKASFLANLQESMRFANENSNSIYWVAVCILSHGRRTCNRDEVFSSDGLGIDRKSIVNSIVDARHWPNLQMKPKIVIFQACRSNESARDESDLHMEVEEVQQDAPAVSTINGFPSMANYLIASSTIEDFPAWHSNLKGSFYIKALCEVLDSSGHKQSVDQVLTNVNEKMAQQDPRYAGMSEFSSVLTKTLVFQRTRESMKKAVELMVLDETFRDYMHKFEMTEIARQ